MAGSDLTTSAAVISEQLIGPLTTMQRESPRVKRMDIWQRIYRFRFKGMALKRTNGVPFKDIRLPLEFTQTCRREAFLAFDSRIQHPGRIVQDLFRYGKQLVTWV